METYAREKIKIVEEETKPKVRVDIKSNGIESAVIHGPFDEDLEALTVKDYDIISLSQNALLRIEYGENHGISTNRNWTREGILYTPGEKPRLLSRSPLFQWAEQATSSHKNEDKFSEFYLTKWQANQCLSNSVEFPQSYTEIPTDELDSNPLTVFAFGGEKGARNYGQFLRSKRISKMPVWTLKEEYVNHQSWPFVRPLSFWYLGFRSGIDGSRDLIKADTMRGIKKAA